MPRPGHSRTRTWMSRYCIRMRVVGDREHGEVLLAEDDHAVRPGDELGGHLRAERDGDRRPRRPVRGPAGGASEGGRRKRAIGEEDGARDGDDDQRQAGAAPADDAPLVRAGHDPEARAPGSACDFGSGKTVRRARARRRDHGRAPVQRELPVGPPAAREIAVMPRSGLAGLSWHMNAAARIPVPDVDHLTPGWRREPGLERFARDL